MSGKDKGYSKAYKVASEYAVGSARSKTYIYPNFSNGKAKELITQNCEFSAVQEVLNQQVLFSEYKNGRTTLNVYDFDKNDYTSQYILNEIGGLYAVSWKDEICLLKWTDEVTSQVTTCIVNFMNNNFLWKKELADFGDIHIPKMDSRFTVACVYGEQQLFTLDTLTGRELWRHDYTEFGRYDDGFQRTLSGRVYDFKFWQDSVIVCTSGCYLMRVDLATGRTHWLLQLADPYGIFVIDGDVIHLSQFRRYYLVNAHTGKVIAEHDITTLEWPQDKYGSILGISGHSVDEEFIYITAQSAQKVLVIDKQQWEMVQILDISEGKGSPQASSPLLAGNKLCQVDGQSDLHVFERVA